MKLQNRSSAYSVTTYKRSIIKTEIANSCQWIQLLDQCLAGNRYLLSIYFFTGNWCAVFFRAKLCDNPGRKWGGRINGMWSYHETLLSQASQISDPEEEVGIWCYEKEIQNERRQALNDALVNLASGRFIPILSTLNASWDDISSTQQKYYTPKAREAVAAMLSVISPGQEKDLWKCI